MRLPPCLFNCLIAMIAASTANGVATTQTAVPIQPTPVILFIPGRITIGSTSELIVRVKGLETPGRSLFTSPCQIKYTVFTRDGKGVLLYPKAGTLCADIAYGFSTRRGAWKQFSLDLRWVKQANLPTGTYWITASIAASEQMGSSARLPAFVSNTAQLQIP
jgi:hypothetical protein